MLPGPLVALLGHIPFIIASSLPTEYTAMAISDDNYGNKLVFCHFMAWHSGIPHWIGASDYDDDMKRAKYVGIDAFALNIGTDSYTDTQLGFAYQSAANNGMKVFI
ncbi:hypothetical protein VN97_g13194, partial [Penicillium thymicola]